jgi:hypothetical protein
LKYSGLADEPKLANEKPFVSGTMPTSAATALRGTSEKELPEPHADTPIAAIQISAVARRTEPENVAMKPSSL